MKMPPTLLAAILAAGCTATLEPGRTHAKVHIARGDSRRFITISKSASDHRAVKNMIGDAKRTIREMEA